MVVRTTLLSTDWAVRLEPAVWTWKRHIIERGSRAPKRSRMMRAHMRRAARNLATSSKSSLHAAKKKRQPAGEGVDVKPARAGRLDVGDAVGEGEGQLLGRGRAGLAHVVAADRDRVPARQLARAELEDVRHQAHRGCRGIDVRAARDVLLEDVVLDRAAQLGARDATLVGDGDVEGEQDRRRGVDRHRGRDLAQRQAVEQHLHVVDRADRHADPAHLALPRPARRRRSPSGWAGRRRPTSPVWPCVEQVAEAPVGFGGGGEAGVLAHRPQPAAIHGRLDAARERELARHAQRLVRLPAVQVLGRVEIGNLDVRGRGEPVATFSLVGDCLRPAGATPLFALHCR